MSYIQFTHTFDFKVALEFALSEGAKVFVKEENDSSHNPIAYEGLKDTTFKLHYQII